MELTLDQALQLGIKAHKAGKVQEADRYYTAILKAQPKHPDANHNMGVLAVGVGKVEDALPFFKTALEANPNIAQFWLSYIDALIKLDRMTDAKAIFDQAKKNGVQSDSLDRLENQLVRKKIGSSPSPQSNLFNSAKALKESGRYAEAVDLLKEGVTQDTKNANLLSLLSHCLILNNELENAFIYHERAKKINPDLAAVCWNESRLFLQQKRFSEALAAASAANRRFPREV